MKEFFVWVYLVFWAVGSLYFGVAGVVRANLSLPDPEVPVTEEQHDAKPIYEYKGITFKDSKELKTFIADEGLYNLFPWILNFPDFASILLTCCSFGALGAIIHLLYGTIYEKKNVEWVALLVPIFGFLMGLLLLGISYIVPAALIIDVDKIDIKPTSQIFICLIGGTFSQQTFKVIQNFIFKTAE